MTAREQILAGYDQMWVNGKVDLLRGNIAVDEVPGENSNRWGVSVLLRLPTALNESLMELVHKLRIFAGERHTFHVPDSFHVTFRSIELFRGKINSDDERVKTYIKILKQLASSFDKFTIQFQGITANRVGIILQGFPQTDQIQLFRQQLHEQLEKYQLLEGVEQQKPRLNAHVSLVVFGSPILADTSGLVNYIDQHRLTYYGEFSTDKLDLVRYERQLDSVRIITLDQITLGKH